jgi:hypothetical protein
MLRWGNDPIISNLPETVLMTDTFRAMCAEPLAQEAYVAFVQICKGGSDDAGTYDADEAIVRCALKRLDELEGALLAQPEPEVPTDEEIMELMPQEMRDDLAAAARALTGDIPWPDNPKAAVAMRIILNRHAVNHVRAALARWGNSQGILDSSPQPVAVSERLPGAKDCALWPGDPEATPWCWAGKYIDGGWEWAQISMLGLGTDTLSRIIAGGGWTHWLFANALPLPEAQP